MKTCPFFFLFCDAPAVSLAETFLTSGRQVWPQRQSRGVIIQSHNRQTGSSLRGAVMSTLTADPHMLPGCVSARRLAGCRNGYISSRHAVMFRLAAPPRAVMRVRLAAWLTRPVASPGCSGGLLRQNPSDPAAEVRLPRPGPVNTRGRVCLVLMLKTNDTKRLFCFCVF